MNAAARESTARREPLTPSAYDAPLDFDEPPLPAVLQDIERLPSEAVIGGLCAGISRKYGIDPLLVRTAAILAGISGGIGVVLYLIGWALTPEEGDAPQPRPVPMDRLLPTWRTWTQRQVLLVSGLAAIGFAITVGSASIFGWAPLIIILGMWWLAQRGRPQPASAFGQVPTHWAIDPTTGYYSRVTTPLAAQAPTLSAQLPLTPPLASSLVEYSAAPTLVDRSAPPIQPSWPSPQPGPAPAPAPDAPQPAFSMAQHGSHRVRESRPHWALALVTTVIAVVIGAVTWRLVPLEPPQRTSLSISVTLAVVGLGLLLGSKLGKSLWLIVLGIGLAFSLVGSSAGGRNQPLAEYAFSSAVEIPGDLAVTARTATISFDALRLDKDVKVALQLTASDVVIDLPQQINVVIDYQTNAAVLRLPDGTRSTGIASPARWNSEQIPGAPTLHVTMEMNAANVEVIP